MIEFDSIYREHYTALFYYAVHITGDEEASRDIVSDVFMALYQHLGELRPDSLRAWLLTSCRHRCVDRLRRLGQERRYTEHYLHTAEGLYADDRRVEREDGLVAEMLLRLTPPTDEILRLCYLERKKYREVAALLSISESTVKKHIVKALRTLRNLYRGSDAYPE